MEIEKLIQLAFSYPQSFACVTTSLARAKHDKNKNKKEKTDIYSKQYKSDRNNRPAIKFHLKPRFVLLCFLFFMIIKWWRRVPLKSDQIGEKVELQFCWTAVAEEQRSTNTKKKKKFHCFYFDKNLSYSGRK